MKTVAVFVALITMIGLSGKGIDNSLPNSGSSGKGLSIFTFYRQLIPDPESITFISDGQTVSATYHYRLKNGVLPGLKSHVRRAAGLLFRFGSDKPAFRDTYVKEIIIPVILESGERLYFFPEHRLVIEFTGRTHSLPLIRPVFITESEFAVWLRITL
ncbi:hypothetical protein EG832_02355 [bacterium]|nr:hypothetical protein [bacterium]